MPRGRGVRLPETVDGHLELAVADALGRDAGALDDGGAASAAAADDVHEVAVAVGVQHRVQLAAGRGGALLPQSVHQAGGNLRAADPGDQVPGLALAQPRPPPIVDAQPDAGAPAAGRGERRGGDVGKLVGGEAADAAQRVEQHLPLQLRGMRGIDEIGVAAARARQGGGAGPLHAVRRRLEDLHGLAAPQLRVRVVEGDAHPLAGDRAADQDDPTVRQPNRLTAVRGTIDGDVDGGGFGHVGSSREWGRQAPAPGACWPCWFCWPWRDCS